MSFSQKAQKALVHLFKPYNDIDIFVEDTTIHRVYEVLFKRLLPEDISLRHIFQLPGREAVINECKNYLNKYGRKTLFIIDGDFNILVSIEDFSSYTNLYQLKVYCIENLLVSNNSLIEVASDCLPNTKFDDIGLIIDYDNFISEVSTKLAPLIVIYYVVHLFDDKIETVGRNVNNFFKEGLKVLSLDEDKIKHRIEEIKNILYENHSVERIQEEIDKINRILPTDSNEIIKLICGRRYLIPLVYHHLHRKANYSSNYNQLKARLARHCDVNIDPGLKSALIKASTR